jgi:glycerophosphoryl diester phosphodiesterase
VKADDAVEPTLAVLRDADALDRVCLSSFSTERIRQLRRGAPAAASCFSRAEIALLRRAPTRWLQAHGKRRGGGCVQVPIRHGAITVVTPGFVARAHAIGVPVHVWTINDPDEMRYLLDIGVDGLMSDRVDVLRDVLRERGEWR